MAVTVSQMFIPVHDPDAALGFYRDALGFEVRSDVAAGGFRWVTVEYPRAGSRSGVRTPIRLLLTGSFPGCQTDECRVYA